VLLLKPKNQKHVRKHRVKLDWNDVTCATNYKVKVRLEQPKGNRVFGAKNLGQSQVKTKHLDPGNYYWRVLAVNAAGKSRSSWRTFQINP